MTAALVTFNDPSLPLRAELIDGDTLDADVNANFARLEHGTLWQRFGSDKGPSLPLVMHSIGRRLQHVSIGTVIWQHRHGGGIAWDTTRVWQAFQ